MLLNDYMLAEDTDRLKWLNSINMKVGLPYFGGKSRIGKYLFNNIFNLAVQMKKDGRSVDIFIDAFTGGGKMGLSVPVGWFKTVVINDLDYGVYSFYKCCQDKKEYIKLIYMIEEIGRIMDANLFFEATWLREYGPGKEKFDKSGKVKKEEALEPVVAAALTYWVTSSSFNNITDPESASYNNANKINETEYNREQERRSIEKIVNRARKVIPKIHEQLNKHNYIIENLDYMELIKKYNGLSYKDLEYKEYEADESLKEKNKLWYFDPPYHPWTLNGGKSAPYPNTFPVDKVDKMTSILHGDYVEEFGELSYFIKSDYDPKEALKMAQDEAEKCKKNNNKLSEKAQMILDLEKNGNQVSNAFAPLEEYPFIKVCVGAFDKGAMQFNEDIGDMEKTIGMEYIWTRGFPEGYQNIEGEEAD